MKAKHTPGPWEIHYRADLPAIGIWSSRYGEISPICRIWHAPEGSPPRREIRETDKANAALIVAAPELLASLKKAAEVIRAIYTLDMEYTGEWDMLPPAVLDEAELIIAKAEGR